MLFFMWNIVTHPFLIFVFFLLGSIHAPILDFWWCLCPSLKNQIRYLPCMFCHLSAINRLDSLLVWHLLTACVKTNFIISYLNTQTCPYSFYLNTAKNKKFILSNIIELPQVSQRWVMPGIPIQRQECRTG